jgi:hypothetical protein
MFAKVEVQDAAGIWCSLKAGSKTKKAEFIQSDDHENATRIIFPEA